MARSTYIYVPTWPHRDSFLAGGWTVKREMVGWLKRQPAEVLDGMVVYRLSDGAWREPAVMDLAELLA